MTIDNGTTTTTSQITGEQIRRRVLKIKDATASTYVTIWNNKVNKELINNIQSKYFNLYFKYYID